MKKHAKQKSRKQKAKKRQAKHQKRQQHQPKLQVKPGDPQVTHQVANEENDNSLALTVAADQRAALLARSQQPQWKQKIKVGKAAAARVAKRYNRAG